MRILVIGDLHGRKPIIKNKNFDVTVFVGDVCDDREVSPLLKELFRARKKGKMLDEEEFLIEKVGGKKELEKIYKRSLKKGNEILQYLDSFGKPIFMVAGNWDQSYGETRIKDINKNNYTYLKTFYDWYLGDKINSKLIKGIKNLRNCMFHSHEFEGVNFMGYGLSSGPEKIGKKRKKEDYSKSQVEKLIRASKRIDKKLSKVYKKGKRLPTFFITHNIPYGTKLDIVMDKKSYVYKKHLGSTTARNFCSKHQPVVCVGGHVHDHRGKDKIKKTIVINPGYGGKAQVLIDFDEKKGKVKRVEFVR